MLRHEILNLLSAHPKAYVSGESISRQLKVTRGAVWKQIQILKEEGFAIEGQTKKGYCLLKTPFPLHAWVLKKKMMAMALGKEIYLEDSLTSTNARARELVQQSGASDQVVLARRQSLGRGRMQRLWEAPEGGLWFSVILQPKLSLADASKITLAAGVAVADAFAELYGLSLGIKWPNDLLYEGLKIAGILGEVAGEWNAVQTLILGIGVNVNFPRESLSASLKAVTLQDILGFDVDLNTLATVILKHLEKEIVALEKGAFEELRVRWLKRAVGLGQEMRVFQAEGVVQGVFKGITVDGTLLLETIEGEKSFLAGEVELPWMLGDDDS